MRACMLVVAVLVPLLKLASSHVPAELAEHEQALTHGALPAMWLTEGNIEKQYDREVLRACQGTTSSLVWEKLIGDTYPVWVEPTQRHVKMGAGEEGGGESFGEEGG